MSCTLFLSIVLSRLDLTKRFIIVSSIPFLYVASVTENISGQTSEFCSVAKNYFFVDSPASSFYSKREGERSGDYWGGLSSPDYMAEKLKRVDEMHPREL